MKGMPFESVARMIGHKNLKTTRPFPRIVNAKIGNDMIELASKIGARLSLSLAMQSDVG